GARPHCGSAAGAPSSSQELSGSVAIRSTCGPGRAGSPASGPRAGGAAGSGPGWTKANDARQTAAARRCSIPPPRNQSQVWANPEYSRGTAGPGRSPSSSASSGLSTTTFLISGPSAASPAPQILIAPSTLPDATAFPSGVIAAAQTDRSRPWRRARWTRVPMSQRRRPVATPGNQGLVVGDVGAGCRPLPHGPAAIRARVGNVFEKG